MEEVEAVCDEPDECLWTAAMTKWVETQECEGEADPVGCVIQLEEWYLKDVEFCGLDCVGQAAF